MLFIPKDSESRLDGDLSEPRTGMGGGGTLVYTHITCQTLRLFSGRLTKKSANLGGGQALLV